MIRAHFPACPGRGRAVSAEMHPALCKPGIGPGLRGLKAVVRPLMRIELCPSELQQPSELGTCESENPRKPSAEATVWSLRNICGCGNTRSHPDCRAACAGALSRRPPLPPCSSAPRAQPPPRSHPAADATAPLHRSPLATAPPNSGTGPGSAIPSSPSAPHSRDDPSFPPGRQPTGTSIRPRRRFVNLDVALRPQ